MNATCYFKKIIFYDQSIYLSIEFSTTVQTAAPSPSTLYVSAAYWIRVISSPNLGMKSLKIQLGLWFLEEYFLVKVAESFGKLVFPATST